MQITISHEQRETIKKCIKEDGYLITGWPLMRGHSAGTFHHVLKNSRGQVKYPSPKCVAVIKDLVGCGYLLLTPQQAIEFRKATRQLKKKNKKSHSEMV